MHPKKWRRAGIALSIIWLLSAGYWGLDSGLHRGDFAAAQFALCMENSSHPGDASGPCLARFDKDYPDAIKYRWWRALAAGIAPVGIAWLLAYGLNGRRRRGFKPA